MNETEFRPTVTQGGYEPCEECGAPLDTQQRYCVNCAARRGNGANPSSRYFAAMSKKARRPLTRPPAKAGPTSRAAAVGFFALLPIAVALGVVVGRSDSGSGNEEALLRALHNQETATASTAAPGTAKATASKGKGGKKEAKALKADEKNAGKVLNKTKNGVVHQVTGYKPSQKQIEEGTKIVDEAPSETGENYIKAQQNLPDVIPVGGEPGSTPAPSNGAEP